MKRRIVLIAVLATTLPVGVLASNWDFDPAHTHSGFTVRHMVISNVRGEFGKTTGKVNWNDTDITRSGVEVVIDATTIDTRQPARDTHLRSADFFDVGKYPTITFKSTKVEKAGEGKLKVTGDLTMKGVTRPVVLDVEGPSPEVKGGKGEIRRGFSATVQINRKDFGLTWNQMIEAGPVVGDKVNVELEVELIRGVEAAASK